MLIIISQFTFSLLYHIHNGFGNCLRPPHPFRYNMAAGLFTVIGFYVKIVEDYDEVFKI